ncbi:MAG TPA: AmmeMemoRadiSam system protein A [Sedimentisphaerales bacterium]|nr:AmmeMemoRadiSam system protein A [Sedimentisphaerales bacterium]
MLNESQRNILLKVAHDTVEAVISGRTGKVISTDDADLNSHCGCFVTLKNHGDLRGCIGQFTSNEPLIELIADMAKASCRHDSRFFSDPITIDELEQLDIEISVLSSLKKTNDPLSLRLGIDGIYIKKGFAGGCFLPQVATETGWSKEEFLSYCCSHKAGLPGDAWKDKKTEVYLFSAEVFGAYFKEIS